LPTSFSGSTDLTGLAAFGKVALALGVIIVIIFLCTWLLRRIGPTRAIGGRHLKIVATKAVGTKERVVVVDAEGVRLVLGVTSGGISKLYETEAVDTPAPPTAEPLTGSFATRFAKALKQNLRGDRP
jgi:flagellar protein FliO/FliZ